MPSIADVRRQFEKEPSIETAAGSEGSSRRRVVGTRRDRSPWTLRTSQRTLRWSGGHSNKPCINCRQLLIASSILIEGHKSLYMHEEERRPLKKGIMR